MKTRMKVEYEQYKQYEEKHEKEREKQLWYIWQTEDNIKTIRQNERNIVCEENVSKMNRLLKKMKEADKQIMKEMKRIY